MGQNYIDGSLASLIVSAQPFFVAVLAHFMVRGDRFTPLKVLSILMAVVGLVIVSYPGLEMMSLDRSEGTFIVLGVSLMLVNCISAAYGNIIVSKIDFSKVPDMYKQLEAKAKDVEGGKVSNLLVYILGRDGMYASWGVEGTREKYNADFDLNGNLTSYEKQ